MYLLLRVDQRLKQKPRRRTLAYSSTKTVPISERSWTDIEAENYSSIAYPLSKQLSTLLRHGDLPREEDGAIEFLRLKDYLRNDFVHSHHWSDELWKSTMARGGRNKKRFQCCTDPSGQEILYLRALFKVIQDAIPLILHCRTKYSFEQFLRVRISHRMCNQLTLHHEFRVDTRRTKFEQKTDGILHVCGSHEQRTRRSEQN